jgi:hypothetical protein
MNYNSLPFIRGQALTWIRVAVQHDPCTVILRGQIKESQNAGGYVMLLVSKNVIFSLWYIDPPTISLLVVDGEGGLLSIQKVSTFGTHIGGA